MSDLESIEYGCIVLGLWFMFLGFVIFENILLGLFGFIIILLGTSVSLVMNYKRQNMQSNKPNPTSDNQ